MDHQRGPQSGHVGRAFSRHDIGTIRGRGGSPFVAKAAGGRTVSDVVPEWFITPGSGEVDRSGAFVADVPGTYRVLATLAGKSAEAVVTVRPRDAERPATIVGRLPIKMMAAEFWLHPDGKHGYLTTIGDRIYAINLADPAKPAITDSVSSMPARSTIS